MARKSNSAAALAEEVEFEQPVYSTSNLSPIDPAPFFQQESSITPPSGSLTGIAVTNRATMGAVSIEPGIRIFDIGAASTTVPISASGAQFEAGENIFAGWTRRTPIQSLVLARFGTMKTAESGSSDTGNDLTESMFSRLISVRLRKPQLQIEYNAEFSEAGFRRLAMEDPQKLISLLATGSLRPAKLTFAAEAAGLITDSEAARAALLPLLRHSSAMVREGAIYGISRHIDNAVSAELEKLASNDSSAGVREAAAEALES